MIAELIDLGNRNFFAANSKKGSRKPKPINIERPRKSNEPEPVKRKATLAEMEAIFGAPRRPPSKRAE